MPEYTEGIVGDGAAILKDGMPMSVSEVIAELNKANALESELDELRAAVRPVVVDWISSRPRDFAGKVCAVAVNSAVFKRIVKAMG